MHTKKLVRELPNRFLACTNEEEVKSEFCKAFGFQLDASRRMDLYTQDILFEFKYDINLSSVAQRSRVIAQILYYIYRLKNGKDSRPIPPRICGIDKNEAFIVSTAAYKKIYDEDEKYDWDRAASSPDHNVVKTVKSYKATTDIHIFKFGIEEDYLNFVNSLQSQIGFFFNDLVKKTINETTFSSAFALWKEFFEDYVKNGTKTSEYFVADIKEGGSYILSQDGLVAFELSSQELRKKPIPMKDYEYFWNTYSKCKDQRIMVSIRQKIDRLSKEDFRRFTGEFYTPIEFANKAISYLIKTAGDRWWERGYRLWDMAAGSGNLEYELPEEALPYCYISTLLQDDVNYCRQIYPEATVFQYDYLNDDVKMLFEKKIDAFKMGIPTNMPEPLLRDLSNPNIKWIIFINPPFVTANVGKRNTDIIKDEVSFTEVRRLMNEESLGETSRELFSQFLWRISKEFAGRNALLGIFSKIKYINSNNDQRMRDSFFKYEFERGFCFPSTVFSGSKGNFPVGFLVWNLGKEKPLSEQNIVLDIFNEYVEKIGTKTIPVNERSDFLSKWVPRYRNLYIMPPLSAALTVAANNKDIRDRVAEGFLASCMALGNDFQHQNYTALLSSPYVSAGAFSITSANFKEAMIMHTVRRLPKATWINDRDQFMAPENEDFDDEFVSDCVVWSLFSGSNATASMKDVIYKKNIYQIRNQLYPFLLDVAKKWRCSLSTVQDALHAAKRDRFAALWLASHKLSSEAIEVLNNAEVVYKEFYAHLAVLPHPRYKIAHWDVGLCQIKMALHDAGVAQDEVNKMNIAHKLLGQKLLPRLYEYGFLIGAQKMFEEETEED